MIQADAFPAGMRPSLLHDLEAGHRLERPGCAGAVARMAREAGLAAPVNRSVFAPLKPYIDGSQARLLDPAQTLRSTARPRRA